MKCFYHNDNDGKCAARIVYEHSKIVDNYGDKYIELDHIKPFPLDTIFPDELVYIVDYSISPDEMRQLLKITPNVVWIDHHKSAIERYSDFEHDIPGVRYDGVSGCMLAWCYFTAMTDGGFTNVVNRSFDEEMTKSAPWEVKLINDWDIWKFSYGDNTRWFQMAFSTYDFSPTSPKWEDISNCFNLSDSKGRSLLDLIKEGKVMMRFRDSWAKDYMDLGFAIEFEGYKCFVVNLGNAGRDYFKSLPNLDEYDILMRYVYNGEKFNISMYSQSDTCDVSKIAMKYGGGGHKGAAGFTCVSLPFKAK